MHFITWFRRGLELGYDRKTAVLEAYERCGQAMLQTTLICGLGLMAYAFSPFVPTARFAVLMFCMLSAAILGDVIQLPAILAGPLGRFFESTPAKDAPPVAELEPAKAPSEARV